MNTVRNQPVSFNHNKNVAPTQYEINRAVSAMRRISTQVHDLIERHGPTVIDACANQQPYTAAVRMLIEREYGWTFAGSGHFALVFAHNGLALKIGLKTEDSGAMYAAWCRANQGKPGVPTIYALQRAGQCYMVLTDRLEPFMSHANHHNIAEYGEVQAVFKGRPARDEFPVVATAREIAQFFDVVSQFDLHEANVMIDRNGGLVITDPVSFTAHGRWDNNTLWQAPAVANDNALHIAALTEDKLEVSGMKLADLHMMAGLWPHRPNRLFINNLMP